MLDPLPGGWRGRIATAVMAGFGVRLFEEPFYAGHIDTPDGVPAQRAAAEHAVAVALPEMERIVAASPLLARLNAEWGRNTVLLQLCKSIAMTSGGERSLYGYALRVQVARALAARDGHSATLLLEQPAMFGARCLQEMAPDLAVLVYGPAAALLRSKTEVARQAARTAVRGLRGIRARLMQRRRTQSLRQRGATRPGVLLLQEDELTADRSYRSQPHWLDTAAPPPAFNTYVLAHRTGAPAPMPDPRLAALHVDGLSDDDLLALAHAGPAPAIVTSARRAGRRCWRRALISASPSETTALALASRLFGVAADLGATASRLGIRAFMTAENYLVAGDAMTLVAQPLGIHTLSYQYTNIALRSPLMLTTADVLFTLAPAFHTHWGFGGIRPGAFVDIGYPYDGAIALVRARAQTAKQRLRAAGARCVIAYFDENFFVGTKYGLTTYEEHCAELQRLLELVLDDESIGVVTKVQFHRNAASRIPSLQTLVQRAEATGRYLELSRGEHRNVVLPAEAALTADITIGHAVGGTASLEAALAGARSIVLNPYRMRDANQALYRRADILFESLDAALAAIDEYREGRRPLLGDWTTVLPHLESFRDGGAGQRLRAALDFLSTDKAPPAGARDVGTRLSSIWPRGYPETATRRATS